MTYWDPIPTARAAEVGPLPAPDGGTWVPDPKYYARDGDDHWTPELIRAWWRDRARVREWAVALDRKWSVSSSEDQREAAGEARAYVAHIEGDLGDRLRGYLFRQEEGRPARTGEALPVL